MILHPPVAVMSEATGNDDRASPLLLPGVRESDGPQGLSVCQIRVTQKCRIKQLWQPCQLI